MSVNREKTAGQVTANDLDVQEELNQQKALARAIARIRASLDLDRIFTTTAQEVRQLLEADRVAVFRFHPELNWEGEFISEDVGENWTSALGVKIYDHCFGQQFAIYYQQGQFQVVADIYDAGLSDCHAQILAKFQVRANLVVPLLQGSDLWGLLCIHQCSGPRVWQTDEIEFIQQIADHLAVALQHDRYVQQLQEQAAELARAAEREKHAERQKSISKIADKIRQSLEIETIFAITTDEVRQILQADRVAIYQFLPDWTGKFVAESMAEGWTPLVGTLPVIEDTHLQETQGGRYANHEHFAVDDIYQAGHADCHIQLLEQFEAKAYAIVPLFQGEKLWGLLAAYQNSQPRHWQDDEIDLLNQIGAQLTLALKQLEYVQQMQAQSAELTQAKEREKMLERQKTLAVIVDKIRRSLDIETIFSTTTEEVRKLLQSDRVIIYRFNPDWSGACVSESVNPRWTALLNQQIEQPRLTENISDCSLKSLAELSTVDTYLQETQGGRFVQGQPFRTCDDIYQADFTPCYLQILESMEAKAYVIVGIYQGENLWGLLAAYQNSRPRNWEPEEVHLLTQIGTQLGVALQQAELLEQTRRQAAELTEALQNLQKTQTQMIQSEKMASLGHLVAGIAHEINNPINFIHGNIGYIGDYTQDLLDLVKLYQAHDLNPPSEIIEKAEEIDLDFINEDLPEALASMKMGTERIRNIVLSLRTFARHDEAEMKAVDIHQGIDSTLLILQHRLSRGDDRPDIKVLKNYGGLPKVECYGAEINQVLMNILVNAIDALENPDNPWIKINTELIENQACIKISDNGCGIEESLITHVFDPFFTTKKVGKGTGLGLSVSYQIIVEKHRGQLECHSQLGQGTDMIITLPIKQSKNND
jgi:GAF domain-containing protein